jgi:hypothetical protein
MALAQCDCAAYISNMQSRFAAFLTTTTTRVSRVDFGLRLTR